MNTVVYLIRHGHVTFPVNEGGHETIYGPDVMLSSKGKQQAIDLGRNLRMGGIKLDHIYTSPLPRAKETAIKISVEVGNTPVTEHEGLRATLYPTWEGRPISEFDGNIFVDESMEEVDKRITETFRNIIASHKGKTIGIVTHGEESGILLNRLHNPDRLDSKMEEEIPNGQAYRLEISDNYLLIEGQKFSPEGIFRGKER